MKLRITTDLEDMELAKALAVTATSHGIHTHVHEIMEKSKKKELENHERWAREAENEWNDHLTDALKIVRDYVGQGIPALHKSRKPGLDWTNPDTLLAVADLIRDVIAGAFGALEPSRRERWAQTGVILPNGNLNPVLGTLLQGGILGAKGTLPDHSTLNQLRHALAKITWNAGEQLAVNWINEHGARYIQWFASGVGNQALSRMRSTQSQAVGNMVSEMMNGTLKPRNNAGEILQDRASVKSWRGIATELYHEFKGNEEIERDWRRVAATETRLASNAGRLLGMEQMGVKYVEFVVHPTACNGCKKLYLNADGTPKKFELQTILEHFWANDGLNVGRKASLIGQEGGWLPVGGAAHPFDRCYPQTYKKENE